VFSDSSARSRSISGDSLRSGQAQPSSPPRAPPRANAPGTASLAVSHHSPGAEGSPARSRSSRGSRRSRASQRTSKCCLLKNYFLNSISASFKAKNLWDFLFQAARVPLHGVPHGLPRLPPRKHTGLPRLPLGLPRHPPSASRRLPLVSRRKAPNSLEEWPQWTRLPL